MAIVFSLSIFAGLAKHRLQIFRQKVCTKHIRLCHYFLCNTMQKLLYIHKVLAISNNLDVTESIMQEEDTYTLYGFL